MEDRRGLTALDRAQGDLRHFLWLWVDATVQDGLRDWDAAVGMGRPFRHLDAASFNALFAPSTFFHGRLSVLSELADAVGVSYACSSPSTRRLVEPAHQPAPSSVAPPLSAPSASYPQPHLPAAPVMQYPASSAPVAYPSTASLVYGVAPAPVPSYGYPQAGAPEAAPAPPQYTQRVIDATSSRAIIGVLRDVQTLFEAGGSPPVQRQDLMQACSAKRAINADLWTRDVAMAYQQLLRVMSGGGAAPDGGAGAGAGAAPPPHPATTGSYPPSAGGPSDAAALLQKVDPYAPAPGPYTTVHGPPEHGAPATSPSGGPPAGPYVSPSPVTVSHAATTSGAVGMYPSLAL